MRALDLYENNHESQMKEAWNLIQQDCQPFLKSSNNKPLFRGIKELDYVSSRVSFTKLTVHQDRLPRDSGKIEHIAVIKAMKESGFKAHRGNSIFCQASIANLQDYGEIYVVFPIGNFNVSWSPVVRDWVADKTINKFLSDNISNRYQITSPADINVKKLTRWIDANYIEGNLESVMEDKYLEIMINCKEYYAVLWRNPTNNPDLWDFSSMKEIINNAS